MRFWRKDVPQRLEQGWGKCFYLPNYGDRLEPTDEKDSIG